MKNSITEKGLAFCITLLFIFTIITLTGTPKQINTRNIITVDDEPGDADYTSIKEALNNSNFGDTIEVYSGIYKEDDITIFISNLTINAIPYELGEGNDSGKPIIEAINSKDAILVNGDSVTLTGFKIEIKSNCGIIIYSDDNVISGNIFQTLDGVCILINGTYFGGKRNAIIGNVFSNYNSTFTYAVILDNAYSNGIAENDFLINTNAYFFNSFQNRWFSNYWQNPRILPKLILGKWSIITDIFSATIPWFNIDWHPALVTNNVS